MTLQGALTGVRVLDLSFVLPGPYYSMILANHGAEVTTIEDPEVQEDGRCFNNLNRNKKRMSLNLKTPEGLEIFFKLAEKADVVIEGFCPGVVERLGVDYETIRQLNPGIIYCSIGGDGQTRSFNNWIDSDVAYMSDTTVMDLIDEKEENPVIPGAQIAAIARDNPVFRILLALLAREKTGKGQYIMITQ